jgi:adenylosuccinate synthase
MIKRLKDSVAKMEATAVVGTQWGDEGKGRMIDLLVQSSDAVVRFQGGSNAGHTIVNDKGKFVSHLLPSGVFTKGTKNILGPGMVIEPSVLLEELSNLRKRVAECGEVYVSDRAHVVLSLHKKIEEALDKKAGSLTYGSTKRGIAQVYQFKAAKVGLQMADLVSGSNYLQKRLAPIVNFANIMFRGLGEPETSVEEVLKELKPYIPELKPLIYDIMPVIDTLLKRKAKVLLEGQLGTLRDLDWGIYPYTTSSNTLAGYASVGSGIPLSSIKNVLGVTKAYSTCVGTGPFVTELKNKTGDLIRTTGGEFGATTGRPRRIGWFDAVATRHGARVQGATSLGITLLDVLSCLDTIYACSSYKIGSKVIQHFPTYKDLEKAKPVLKKFAGWKKDITGVRTLAELPKEARRYLDWIEKEVGVPISHISVGPKRDQIIYV